MGKRIATPVTEAGWADDRNLVKERGTTEASSRRVGVLLTLPQRKGRDRSLALMVEVDHPKGRRKGFTVHQRCKLYNRHGD